MRPSRATSRSAKVSRKSRRHTRLSSGVAARNERGKPPRSQSVCRASSPTSASPSPLIKTRSTRPARLSETPRIRPGDALPRSRNLAGGGCRSSSTRNSGKRSGRRCASSITTRPRRRSSASFGWASRARSVGSSRSRYSPPSAAWIWRASVVLPHCLGPRRAVAGLRASAVRTARSRSGRWTRFILEY